MIGANPRKTNHLRKSLDANNDGLELIRRPLGVGVGVGGTHGRISC